MRLLQHFLRLRREHVHDGPLVYGFRGWVLVCEKRGERIVYGRSPE